MKRSEVEGYISWAKELLKRNNITLPMFGYWDVDEFRRRKDGIATIVSTMRGWDVTDFGEGDFSKAGAVLFTIRNGLIGTDIGCPYAEKLILMREGQVLPMHFHYTKTEDIINRAGGVLSIQVYNSLPDGKIDYESDVDVWMDGVMSTVKAGCVIDIPTGCSMTVTRGLYHLFMCKPGYGDVVIGEVSSVNDDNIDNHFAEDRPRFVEIEEDAPLSIPLVNEYDSILGGK